ncbi:MAG: c-type cytochrome [Sandaracinaceae bacterium]|nr:c-type cytochrome [Sandaracinaceae bacterium]
MRRLRDVGGFVLLLLGLAACGQESGSSSSSTSGGGGTGGATVTAEARAEATQIFSTRCAVCHGGQGAGDGPGSAGLSPRPRNLTEAAWQDSVEDSYIERIIQYGGAAVGKSAAMPSNPDLGGRPEVIAALREHVRSLRH